MFYRKICTVIERQTVQLEVPPDYILRIKFAGGDWHEMPLEPGFYEFSGEQLRLNLPDEREIFPAEFWLVEWQQAILDKCVVENVVNEIRKFWPDVRQRMPAEVPTDELLDCLREVAIEELTPMFQRERDPDKRRRLTPSLNWTIPKAVFAFGRELRKGQN